MLMSMPLMIAHLVLILIQCSILVFIWRIMQQARIDAAKAQTIQLSLAMVKRQVESLLVDQAKHNKTMSDNVQELAKTLSLMMAEMPNILKSK